MEESEAEQEIETLKAIWPELQDRPPVWNSPSVAIPVYPLGAAGSADGESCPSVTVAVIYNPRYPKVPPRLELERPRHLTAEEVAELKRVLDVKAKEMSATGMVMVHDLLVLTNDFLSEAEQAVNIANKKEPDACESLFQKMKTKEQHQKQLREEEERVEEWRQRDEEARALQQEEAKGEAQWALVEEKLELERERAARGGGSGAMVGVIPELSPGFSPDEDEDEVEDAYEGSTGDAEGRPQKDEEPTSSDDDDWMNYPEDRDGDGDGGGAAGGAVSSSVGGGVEGTGVVKERSSWYKSQFKELENLGKGGFGTVVKVRNRIDRRLYAVKKVGMDPLDRETNRKIRREVTTISTLIHKNIVRYYQAWLEGGGGAMAIPAAVEEENSSDDGVGFDEDGGGGGNRRGGQCRTESRGTGDDEDKGAVTDRSEGDQSEGDQSETGEDDDDDQSESETVLGFFRAPRSPSAADRRRKEPVAEGALPSACGDLPRGKNPKRGAGSTAAPGVVASSSGMTAVGARQQRDQIYDGGASINFCGSSSRVWSGRTGGPLGRKAKRLLRKQARKEEMRLLKTGSGIKAPTDRGRDSSGEAAHGPKGTQRGTSPSFFGAIVRHEVKCNSCVHSAGRMMQSSALYRKRLRPFPTVPMRGRGRFGRPPSCPSGTEAVPSRHESADRDWSEDNEAFEETGNEEEDGDEPMKSNSDDSWGSGSGDYRPRGQGKLFSDTEFFEFCGSPERVRQVHLIGTSITDVSASWSSEDALLQLCEESRAARLRARPKPSSLLPDNPSRLEETRRLGLLAMTPRAGHGAVDVATAVPPSPPQMEYCENTLRHLIDHGELWKDEPRCWKMFHQMLEGVDFIHSKGIIHRRARAGDLTPPNVFLDAEENVKLGDFGLATSKKAREKTQDDESQGGGHSVYNRREAWTDAKGSLSPGDGVSIQSGFNSVFGDLCTSDTSQLTDGVGTGPYIAPEQGAKFGLYNHKADMWSLGVILFEMLAPRFSTLMERAEAMTGLRSGGQATFPQEFEERVPENAKKVIRWLLTIDAGARPTAAELLSSALLPPKLDMEKTFLREALRVMANPESESFQEIVRALLQRETPEHVDHWYDRDPIRIVSAQIPVDAPAVALVCESLRRVFETHGATPVSPPTLRPKPPPSLAPPPSASKGLLHLLDHRGAVVALPSNLTAPFARFVARSGVTRLKRYQIDRVFRAGPKRLTTSATEAWEADFDIVAIGTNAAVNGVSSPSAAIPATSDTSLGVSRVDAVADPVEVAQGGAGSAFEVAEAEAVLVVSQVVGMFEDVLGSWFLRLGNVKMAQAILDLCGVPLDARSTVMALLGKLARGSITPAKAWAALEAEAPLPHEASVNVRPLLHHLGNDPFQGLARLEALVNRIPAVKSVTGVPNTGRQRELTRKEAVRTKRSLRVFREGCEGLVALLTALGRLGLIPLPLDRGGEEASTGAAAPQNAASQNAGGAAEAKGRKGPRRKYQHQHQHQHQHDQKRDSVTSSERQRHASSDSRAGDRHDGNPREASSKSGFRGGDANVTSPGPHTVPRIGGELEFEAWKGGVRPAFVLVDLGLTQRNGNYASGTIFQAVLAEEGLLTSTEGERYSFAVAEGGRYDDLIARHRSHLRGMSTRVSGESPICAIGVRFAVEKMAALLVTPRKKSSLSLKQQQHQLGGRRIGSVGVDVLVCGGEGLGVQGLHERILVAARLWASGVRAEYLGSDALVRAGAGRGGGLEGAAAACLNAGIPFVVVVRPHTLVSKRAVKVLSVMEKGGGQLEVPLEKLAQHMTDALAALAGPASSSASAPFSQRAPPGPVGSHHANHPYHATYPQLWPTASTIGPGGLASRLAFVDRGQTGTGSLDREKMSRQEYKIQSALERRVGTLLEAAIAGPERSASASAGESEGALVLVTEASFAAIRGLTTAYMLHGEGKAMEMLSDHPEKKYLRNLLAAIQEQEQEVEGGKRRSGKGQGQGRGGGGGGNSKGQLFVYSLADELMDLVTLSQSGGSGLSLHQQLSSSRGGR
ncbi:unnamed protein product [Ascophyllum nodosum]